MAEAESVPTDAPELNEIDAEVAALGACVAALRGLSQGSIVRVIDYLHDRYKYEKPVIEAAKSMIDSLEKVREERAAIAREREALEAAKRKADEKPPESGEAANA